MRALLGLLGLGLCAVAAGGCGEVASIRFLLAASLDSDGGLWLSDGEGRMRPGERAEIVDATGPIAVVEKGDYVGDHVFMSRARPVTMLRTPAFAPDRLAFAVGPVTRPWPRARLLGEPDTRADAVGVEWVTQVAVDLDGDGGADLEQRTRLCGTPPPAAQCYQVRLRRGRDWQVLDSRAFR